jgi:hypothetical protein
VTQPISISLSDPVPPSHTKSTQHRISHQLPQENPLPFPRPPSSRPPFRDPARELPSAAPPPRRTAARASLLVQTTHLQVVCCTRGYALARTTHTRPPCLPERGRRCWRHPPPLNRPLRPPRPCTRPRPSRRRLPRPTTGRPTPTRSSREKSRQIPLSRSPCPRRWPRMRVMRISLTMKMRASVAVTSTLTMATAPSTTVLPPLLVNC